MTIQDLLKELQACDCEPRHDDSLCRCDYRKMRYFPILASRLEQAVEALQEIAKAEEVKYHLTPDGTRVPDMPASAALQQILSPLE